MQSKEIKAELVLNEITLTSIAKQVGVSIPLVSQVISGRATNPKVKAAIAASIGKPVADVFPEKADATV